MKTNPEPNHGSLGMVFRAVMYKVICNINLDGFSVYSFERSELEEYLLSSKSKPRD